MLADVFRTLPMTRRVFLALPLAHLANPPAPDQNRGLALAATIEREVIATVERVDGLIPPLTLGIARVVLRPGATAWASTPHGARMIVVESGVLAVATTSPADERFMSAELTVSPPEPNLNDELFVPAGTTIAFGSKGVASVRNPGARSVVALDVAIYHEEPRPIERAFTTDEGISFQLLASASAAAAPVGRIAVTLERVRLGARSALPADLRVGLTLTYIAAGTVALIPVAGEVYAARAAAATPYSMPGALQPTAIGETRGVTAGGVIFLPIGAEAAIANPMERPVDLLTLAVREVA